MKSQKLRLILAKAVNILFHLQQALVCVCFLSFILGFFFGLGHVVSPLQPLLENMALCSVLLLAPLEILFLLLVPVKIFRKMEAPSWTMLLTALLDPVAAYFAVCIFYGAAHF